VFCQLALCYAMGGDERLLDWSLSAWNGSPRQWTYQHGQSVHREFVRHYDMLHLSERTPGSRTSAWPTGDPRTPRPGQALAGSTWARTRSANYDPEHRLILSPIHPGSGGPAFTSNRITT